MGILLKRFERKPDPIVEPNQIWQDHRPRDYSQAVRVVLTLPYLIRSYYSTSFF